jgi:hypothetical protein
MHRATIPLVLLLTATAAARPVPAAQKDDMPLPRILSAKPLEIKGGDGELRRLQKERYNAAVQEAQARWQEYLAGRCDVDALSAVSRRVLDAGAPLNDKAADRVAFFAQYAELARDMDRVARARHEAGKIPISQAAHARYMRLDAEIRLIQARREAARAKAKK